MVAILFSTLVSLDPPEIDAYLQHEFRDASFTVRIVRKDQKALETINKDFGRSFQFGETQVRMKEPYKLRIDANEEDTAISYILDGPTQRFKIPKLRLNTKRDLSKLPASRQTSMDFGFLTPALFEDLLIARAVKTDPKSEAAVFDLTYKPVFENTSRFRVWLDPTTRTMTRREWYNREGRLLATFDYTAPTRQNRVAIPTRMTVRDAAGEIAGETRLDGVKINPGIDDSVFAG